jgi:hypothetical protein
VDEVEATIRRNVAAKLIPCGCVYEIFPPRESSESLRSLAVALDGTFHACHLEPGKGLYAEFRTISFDMPERPVAA